MIIGSKIVGTSRCVGGALAAQFNRATCQRHEQFHGTHDYLYK
jgi:hypothetical protein